MHHASMFVSSSRTVSIVHRKHNKLNIHILGIHMIECILYLHTYTHTQDEHMMVRCHEDVVVKRRMMLYHNDVLPILI